MRRGIKRIIATAMLMLLGANSLSVYATESNSLYVGKQDDSIITIDNCGYSAEEFMNRVLECTEPSEPLANMQSCDGGEISFSYNVNRQRISKTTKDGTKTYSYNDYGNIQFEILSSGEIIEYLYSNKNGFQVAIGLNHQGKNYYYIVEEDGVISGLLDSNGQTVCEYEYSEFGLPTHIYEVTANGSIEHHDSSNDSFIGCINAIRYRGEYYDIETKKYCKKTGSYYDPINNKVIGSGCTVDMERLFGNQYSTLVAAYDRGTETKSSRLTSNQIYDLTYAASRYYQDGLNYYLEAGTGENWYTNYQDGKVYYLIARIIYGENTYYDNSNTVKHSYLKYNRQGVGWEIMNRYLEDCLRYNKGRTLCFSASGVTQPSLYGILTKNMAFTSINNEANNAMDANNKAYQEAFWIAACIKVCDTFEEWNAIVPRPAGVTSQCYNKGSLTSTSVPNSTWCNVVFPGWNTDYTGANNYSAFAYYSNIGQFNILHSYASENLEIDSTYY